MITKLIISIIFIMFVSNNNFYSKEKNQRNIDIISQIYNINEYLQDFSNKNKKQINMKTLQIIDEKRLQLLKLLRLGFDSLNNYYEIKDIYEINKNFFIEINSLYTLNRQYFWEQIPYFKNKILAEEFAKEIIDIKVKKYECEGDIPCNISSELYDYSTYLFYFPKGKYHKLIFQTLLSELKKITTEKYYQFAKTEKDIENSVYKEMFKKVLNRIKSDCKNLKMNNIKSINNIISDIYRKYNL